MIDYISVCEDCKHRKFEFASPDAVIYSCNMDSDNFTTEDGCYLYEKNRTLSLDDDMIQHVSYTPEIMGYNK